MRGLVSFQWRPLFPAVVLAALLPVGANGEIAAVEPLGPSSRLTGLVISEIMYHPVERLDGRDGEFVEIFNSQEVAADLSGYRLSGAVAFTFPPGTTIAAGGFLVVAGHAADAQAIYGPIPVLGGWTGSLPNGRGVLRLHNRAGAVLLEVEYADRPPWPVAADGTGHSLVLARPSLGEADPAAWGASARIGGSPGAHEPVVEHPLSAVRINEFLARSSAPAGDFIELFNSGREAVDLSGCALSDDPARRKFVLPPGTRIAPRGFLSFQEATLGFGLDAAGERIVLFAPAQEWVIDAVRFEAQAPGVSRGRYPDGAADFRELLAPTPGAANRPPWPRPVIIHEIMYHAVTGDEADTWVELHNRSAAPVDVTGWRFVDGIDFTLPAAVIPAGGYVVVAKDPARLRASHPSLSEATTFGPFGGFLSRRGERLALAMPDATGLGGVTNYIVVDEVTYGTGGRWGRWSDGGGSSLELIDPRSDHRLAPNWADSDETAKSQWTLIEHTGRLDLGTGSPATLHVLAQGAGEFLLDDVEVIPAGGANVVLNPSFDHGLAGWTINGTHTESSLEPAGGPDGSPCLHVRASARGDTGVNQLRAQLTEVPRLQATATLRAKVRWLRGWPEVLLRLQGNYLEAFGQMALPANLGTPGAPNSRAVANAGPAVYAVHHWPTLPAAGEPVVVSARVEDPDGVATVRLRYRVDPAQTVAGLPMRDDGAAGDATAGDGIYSATIPPQPAGALVAFYLEATDSAAPAVTTRFPADAPLRECLVRFGETTPPGGFGTYRLWMTQAVFDRWRARAKLDNHPLDVTFVYGGERVIYNVGALYAGSPHISPGYTSPTGTPCGYVLLFPDDDRFLGATEVVLDWPGRDPSGVLEPAVYWMAQQLDLPYVHRRFIHLHVNGVTDQQRGTIYEDVQQINSRYLEAWAPDDPDGELFKIEQWFEFPDITARPTIIPPTLEKFVTAEGRLKLARYRWSWLKRAIRDSANAYDRLFELVEALNTGPAEGYEAAVNALVDVEQWMRVFAFEHVVNNFDSYGHLIGKNMYAYKPRAGRWQMHMYDLDWLLHISNRAGLTPQSSLFDCEDPVIRRLYAQPAFRRAYFRAVKDALDGPLANLRVNDYLDAKYAALVANGVTKSAGATLAPPDAAKDFLRQRRDFLLEQLAAVAADFRLTTGDGATVVADRTPVTLAGTAPIEVATVIADGAHPPATWTSVKEWRLAVAAPRGQSRVTLQGLDRFGRALPDARTTVTVIVNSPPGLADIQLLSDGAVRLVWQTTPGHAYAIEAADALAPATWRILETRVADGAALEFFDAVRASAQRFYRLRLLE